LKQFLQNLNTDYACGKSCKKFQQRTISLLVQKEIYEGCWACQIQEFKKDEGCKIIKVRDIRADAYRTIYKEEGKETVIQEKDKVVDYKNCNIEIILERYILRRWRRDLIPPALRRNTNRYGKKDESIEKLTYEENFMVKVPNPPSQKMGDVIEDIYAIKKPKQNLVNNPQKARNKGGRRGERIKSGRRTATSAIEQEERNSDSTHITDKEQSNKAS
nr:hypothetical protein [Tanacetum cinerariifolium]